MAEEEENPAGDAAANEPSDVEKGNAPVSAEDSISQRNKNVSIYKEARLMMQVAYLMFVYADLKEYLRADRENCQGDPEMIERLVNCPCSALDIITVYNDNIEKVRELVNCEERTEMYKGVFTQFNTEQLQQVQVTTFSDENADKECVYAVAVNHFLKRVSVVFRGSVTQQDFVKDAKALVGAVDNPLGDPPELGIHLGFKEYLYGEENVLDALFLPNLPKRDQQKTNPDVMPCNTESQKMRKKDIIKLEIKQLLSEHPGYDLRVAGHSLGGALASIFAFECAADDEIPKPVTCITSGAPKVGNLDFLLAFEELEEAGKLRCLRVANYRDPVTYSPPNGAWDCCHVCWCQRRRFRHVGFRLKLTPHTWIISYPTRTRSYCGICCCDCWKLLKHLMFLVFLVPILILCWCWSWKFFRREHTQLAYLNRFDAHKADLEQITLDELYAERLERAAWRIPIIRAGAMNWFCRKKKRPKEKE